MGLVVFLLIVDILTGLSFVYVGYAYALLLFGLLVYRLYRLYTDNHFLTACLQQPRCGGGTDISAEWVCGHCHHTNRSRYLLPTGRTFLEACKECGSVPHSLICPKCRRPIIFYDEAFTKEPKKSAWLTGAPPVTKPTPSRSFDERRKRLEIE
jgi:hypothetical protein